MRAPGKSGKNLGRFVWLDNGVGHLSQRGKWKGKWGFFLMAPVAEPRSLESNPKGFK